MYDPNKQYTYNEPGHRLHGLPVTELHRFDGAMADLPWRGVVGGSIFAFTDNDPYLVEVDPVLYYSTLYENAAGVGFLTLEACVAGRANHIKAVSCMALHASGRVRQIPLNWTIDKEPLP